MELRHTRTSRGIDDYGIGDRVQFNDLCSVKILRGVTAVIVSKPRGNLTVMLDKPIGKYSSDVNGVPHGGNTTVPHAIVDRIG